MLRSLLLLILFLALLGLVGRYDFDDAVKQQEGYCRGVRERVWPDYDGIYWEECKK